MKATVAISRTHETSFIVRQVLLCVQVGIIGGHVA